jgi:hypothetical protein
MAPRIRKNVLPTAVEVSMPWSSQSILVIPSWSSVRSAKSKALPSSRMESGLPREHPGRPPGRGGQKAAPRGRGTHGVHCCTAA